MKFPIIFHGKNNLNYKTFWETKIFEQPLIKIKGITILKEKIEHFMKNTYPKEFKKIELFNSVTYTLPEIFINHYEFDVINYYSVLRDFKDILNTRECFKNDKKIFSKWIKTEEFKHISLRFLDSFYEDKRNFQYLFDKKNLSKKEKETFKKLNDYVIEKINTINFTDFYNDFFPEQYKNEFEHNLKLLEQKGEKDISILNKTLGNLFDYRLRNFGNHHLIYTARTRFKFSKEINRGNIFFKEIIDKYFETLIWQLETKTMMKFEEIRVPHEQRYGVNENKEINFDYWIEEEKKNHKIIENLIMNELDNEKAKELTKKFIKEKYIQGENLHKYYLKINKILKQKFMLQLKK